MRPVEEGDFRFLWAAYRLGAFSDVLAPEMAHWEFAARMLEVVESVDHDWILGVDKPIGLILANGKGRTVEPHVAWFPWASARNKVETMLAFFRTVSPYRKVMAFVRPENKRFFIQMCRYGQLTMGCRVHELFDDGDGYFFYTRGPE